MDVGVASKLDGEKLNNTMIEEEGRTEEREREESGEEEEERGCG